MSAFRRTRRSQRRFTAVNHSPSEINDVSFGNSSFSVQSRSRLGPSYRYGFAGNTKLGVSPYRLEREGRKRNKRIKTPAMGKAMLVIAIGIAAVTCTMAAALVGRRLKSRRKWNRALGILRELEETCGTPVSRLRQVVDAMAVEMHAGLASEGGSKLKMLITFVDRLPNGSGKGTYYAVDLGATNFRVFRVQLGGRRSGILRCDIKTQPLSEQLVSSKELFECIALSLKDFIDKEEEQGSEPSAPQRELGFSCSFPVKQTSISSGAVIRFIEGLFADDMVGKDVAKCLQQEITKIGLDMHVAVLVNDSVGTLALGHYKDEDTVASVVIGTGTNACYIERADAIIKFQDLPTTSGKMVVNIEWANFWSSHLPRTLYDIELDAQSPNPNERGFEKIISGMYLGEIVRRVLLRMSSECEIFGPVSSKLSTPLLLRTTLMTYMHEDETPDLEEVSRILDEVFEIREIPLKVRQLAVKVCDVVARRAARLAAAGIVAILKKMGRDGSGGRTKFKRSVVAIEGDMYTHYGLFREYLEEAVAEILGDDVAPYVVLKEVEDGAGVGAALLAASQSSGGEGDR